MADNETGKLPVSATPVSPELADDRVAIYDMLTNVGMSGRDAHLFRQILEEMASANLIRRFESKMEAVNAKLETMNSKLNLMLWFIGIGVSILIALNLILGF